MMEVKMTTEVLVFSVHPSDPSEAVVFLNVFSISVQYIVMYFTVFSYTYSVKIFAILNFLIPFT